MGSYHGFAHRNDIRPSEDDRKWMAEDMRKCAQAIEDGTAEFWSAYAVAETEDGGVTSGNWQVTKLTGRKIYTYVVSLKEQ